MFVSLRRPMRILSINKQDEEQWSITPSQETIELSNDEADKCFLDIFSRDIDSLDGFSFVRLFSSVYIYNESSSFPIRDIFGPMYSSDLDNSSDIEEEFISALTLLRSTDVDSAEKLRRMLDHSIERKLGHRRILTTKDFLEDNLNHEEIQGNSRNSSPDQFILADSVMVPGVQEVEDEFCEKIDIPRISIPDEGPAEGALCKICNSAKLGPLILLECQECQDVYHPLCHQPPVLDIDVYDPRLVWRCNKCEETSNSNESYKEVKNTPEEIDKQDELKDQKVIKEITRKRISKDPVCFTASKLTADGKQRKSLRPVKDSTIKSRKKHSSTLQKSSSTFQGVGSQLRKRVGSKLSVTRVSTK